MSIERRSANVLSASRLARLLAPDLNLEQRVVQCPKLMTRARSIEVSMRSPIRSLSQHRDTVMGSDGIAVGLPA